ncbi:transaldolase [Cardiosporidium cionae]|uniref:Transaldolase n=1 Tax=Cardiosporidium cionae TaxID=476202 RepID=A0ABQ7JFN6_9APIC|nr:transaldolase [Cardiosporidium cionae]|eukprot:KAF8822848.1 transaldolase [Cardiosporidium cionae]
MSTLPAPHKLTRGKVRSAKADAPSSPPKSVSLSGLSAVSKYSTIVVDSGDLALIRKLQAEDATTNPSLLLQSIDVEETGSILQKSLLYGCLLRQIIPFMLDSTNAAPNIFAEIQQKFSKQSLEAAEIADAYYELQPFVLNLIETLDEAQKIHQEIQYENLRNSASEVELLQNEESIDVSDQARRDESSRKYLSSLQNIEKSLKDRRENMLKLLMSEIITELTIDYFMVLMGCEILKTIPGMISTEVPPKYSFSVQGSTDKGRRLISLYAREGVSKDRVLIKLAATWEGIRAAKILEHAGIRCNMTLLFSLPQAIAAADAKATLISPFVGRIMDWYKANEPTRRIDGAHDPGVQSVVEIYKYYKKFGYKTIVMAASFRNVDEILNLVGCDKLTISPKLILELEGMSTLPVQKLSVDMDFGNIEKIHLDEEKFRWMLNENRMATEKLSDGIRKFHSDYKALCEIIRERLSECNA